MRRPGRWARRPRHPGVHALSRASLRVRGRVEVPGILALLMTPASTRSATSSQECAPPCGSGAGGAPATRQQLGQPGRQRLRRGRAQHAAGRPRRVAQARHVVRDRRGAQRGGLGDHQAPALADAGGEVDVRAGHPVVLDRLVDPAEELARPPVRPRAAWSSRGPPPIIQSRRSGICRRAEPHRPITSHGALVARPSGRRTRRSAASSLATGHGRTAGARSPPAPR